MPIEILSYFLKHENLYVKTAFQVILQCAPLLKGLKVASMISMEKESCWILNTLLEGTDIEYQKLSSIQNQNIVLFFRRKQLEQYLGIREVREFLNEFGYSQVELDQMLKRLSQNLKKGKKSEFPHEIGIFLGYPIEDVKGFIKWQGRKYLFAGYWKVYAHLVETKELFQAYDKAKGQSIQEFLNGKSILEWNRKYTGNGRSNCKRNRKCRGKCGCF